MQAIYLVHRGQLCSFFSAVGQVGLYLRTMQPGRFHYLVILTALLWCGMLYAIFFIAPTELQMGVVQKIFYIHVPSAYAMYLGFGVCGLGSLLFLLRRDDKADALAAAAGEVGLVFAWVVLITGPLWARKAWGTYWTWDPRLTTTLLAALVFSAYWVLRVLGGYGEIERKFAALIALLGLVDLPIIHYSVQRWRGQHPTVITAKGGGIASGMVPALSLGFISMTLLFVILLSLRYRIEKNQIALRALRPSEEYG